MIGRRSRNSILRSLKIKEVITETEASIKSHTTNTCPHPDPVPGLEISPHIHEIHEIHLTQNQVQAREKLNAALKWVNLNKHNNHSISIRIHNKA